ncbi:MAG: serine/threonine-protein kinase [Zavarzinella sp.]
MSPPPLPLSPEIQQLVSTVQKSRLISADDFASLLDRASGNLRKDFDAFSDWLVKQGAFTDYQMSRLKQGTYQGLVLGHYHLLSPLGKGGMGTVFLARDIRSPEKRTAPASGLVALKILPPQKARSEDRALARFLREINLNKQVNHPHLTRMYEAGAIQNVHYIAMQYVRGKTLKDVITTNGPLPIADAARFFAEVADGLNHAHERGLIHRDIKPSNIMVTPNLHAKILDLGLAMMENEELPDDKTIVGGEGYVVGTMDFIAPEQIGTPTGVDGRADLYALGCTLYYTLTGHPPFPGGTSVEKMKKHLNEYPPLITDLNPTVPVEFAKLVEKIMHKVPEGRLQTAIIAREALARWGNATTARPMDVEADANPTEEIVLDLDSKPKESNNFFESIPVSIFEAKQKKHSKKAKETAEQPPLPSVPSAEDQKKADDGSDASQRKVKPSEGAPDEPQDETEPKRDRILFSPVVLIPAILFLLLLLATGIAGLIVLLR